MSTTITKTPFVGVAVVEPGTSYATLIGEALHDALHKADIFHRTSTEDTSFHWEVTRIAGTREPKHSYIEVLVETALDRNTSTESESDTEEPPIKKIGTIHSVESYRTGQLKWGVYDFDNKLVKTLDPRFSFKPSEEGRRIVYSINKKSGYAVFHELCNLEPRQDNKPKDGEPKQSTEQQPKRSGYLYVNRHNRWFVRDHDTVEQIPLDTRGWHLNNTTDSAKKVVYSVNEETGFASIISFEPVKIEDDTQTTALTFKDSGIKVWLEKAKDGCIYMLSQVEGEHNPKAECILFSVGRRIAHPGGGNFKPTYQKQSDIVADKGTEPIVSTALVWAEQKLLQIRGELNAIDNAGYSRHRTATIVALIRQLDEALQDGNHAIPNSWHKSLPVSYHYYREPCLMAEKMSQTEAIDCLQELQSKVAGPYQRAIDRLIEAVD